MYVCKTDKKSRDFQASDWFARESRCMYTYMYPQFVISRIYLQLCFYSSGASQKSLGLGRSTGVYYNRLKIFDTGTVIEGLIRRPPYVPPGG